MTWGDADDRTVRLGTQGDRDRVVTCVSLGLLSHIVDQSSHVTDGVRRCTNQRTAAGRSASVGS